MLADWLGAVVRGGDLFPPLKASVVQALLVRDFCNVSL
jgi:hypothetical protein